MTCADHMHMLSSESKMASRSAMMATTQPHGNDCLMAELLQF